jgi:acetyl-CoA carboxylase carboxyl transferase subunit beta
MSWIDKILPSGVKKDESPSRTSVPEGLWKKCVKVRSRAL